MTARSEQLDRFYNALDKTNDDFNFFVGIYDYIHYIIEDSILRDRLNSVVTKESHFKRQYYDLIYLGSIISDRDYVYNSKGFSIASIKDIGKISIKNANTTSNFGEVIDAFLYKNDGSELTYSDAIHERIAGLDRSKFEDLMLRLHTNMMREVEIADRNVHKIDDAHIFILNDLTGLYNKKHTEKIYPLVKERSGKTTGTYKIVGSLCKNNKITSHMVQDIFNTNNFSDINKHISSINLRFKKHMHEEDDLITKRGTGGYCLNKKFGLKREST